MNLIEEHTQVVGTPSPTEEVKTKILTVGGRIVN